MVAQMFIALVVDDTPEYVVRGDKERRDLLENYKTALRECQQEDFCQPADAIDVAKVRRNMAEILQKVGEEVVREGDDSNARHGQKSEDKKQQPGEAADSTAAAPRRATKPAASPAKPARANRKAAQRTRDDPSSLNILSTNGTPTDPEATPKATPKASKGKKANQY